MNNEQEPIRQALCRPCAEKLGLFMEWKSNHSIYDHASSRPCAECDGKNLLKAETSFTVKLVVIR